jgi:hypothetical protein
MLFLYKTPELFYMTWSLLGGLCLCNNPLLAGHVAAKAAIAAVWFGVSGTVGYSRLRRTTPRPDFHWPASGKLLEWRDHHTISSIVPSLGENACKALIQASGADLPREYVDLMGACDGLVIDNCHIFGLSDIRDSLQVDGISFYQLAEIADIGGLYAMLAPTAGQGTAYLIRDDGASGGYVAIEESGDFYAVVERHLCPSLMKRVQ